MRAKAAKAAMIGQSSSAGPILETSPSQPENAAKSPATEKGGNSQPSWKRNRAPPANKSPDIDLTFKKPRDLPKKPSLDIDNLSEADIARLREDPLLFVAEVARAVSTKLARFKSEEAERQVGIRLTPRNLWLEGDHQDRTDKCNSALDHLSDLRAQLESTRTKLKEVEVALEPTKEKLGTVTSERDAAIKAKTDLETKLATESANLITMTASATTLEKQFGELKVGLNAATDERDQKIAALEALEDRTVEMIQGCFTEAVAQIQYCFPNLEIDTAIVNKDHVLRDGQIIRLIDGQVIYRRD